MANATGFTELNVYDVVNHSLYSHVHYTHKHVFRRKVNVEQNKGKHLDTLFEQLIDSNASVLVMLHSFSNSSMYIGVICQRQRVP